MSTRSITIHHNLDERLLKEWQELWEESPFATFHNGPSWFIACRDGLHLTNYFFVVIKAGDRLDAIFPLISEKRFGITALCSPGERFVDKTTLLLRNKDSEIITLLIKKLQELGNLYLEEFPENIADIFFKNDTTLVKQQASINPYLPLKGDPLHFMTNKMRNKIKNKIKRYRGQVTFQTYRGESEGLKKVFEIDARSTKRQKGKSDLAGDQQQAFLHTLLAVHGEDFIVDVLSYDNVPVIYAIGLTYKKTYHAFQTAFDGKYAFLSPGKMLSFYLFEQLQAGGYELFDYSRGVTTLKTEFTPLFAVQYDILFSKSRLVILWWQLSNFLYNFILESKILYGTYLFFKKLILYH